MATVYLSFTSEGQGSWERVSFPGIVGGGWLLAQGPVKGRHRQCFLTKTRAQRGVLLVPPRSLASRYAVASVG